MEDAKVKQVASNEVWLLLDSRGVGGIETHVCQLAKELRKVGRNAVVVFLGDHGEHPLLDFFRRESIPFRFLNGDKKSLLRAMTHPPQLIHTHGYKAGILGRLTGFIKSVPVVSTFHSGDQGRGKVRLYTTLDEMSSWLAPSIAVSTEIQQRLGVRSRHIPNFVSLPDGYVRRNSQVVAFVGRLSDEKGPDLFCELASQLPDLKFEIYGDGPMLNELRAGYGDVVNFHGNVSSMQNHWRNVGLLCMTSRKEGLPYAALEAMAHGVPVAATGVGGLPELIQSGKNGWIVPPLGMDALINVVRDWSNTPECGRAKMANAARQTVADNFSPQAILPKVLAVYQQATSGTSSGCLAI